MAKKKAKTRSAVRASATKTAVSMTGFGRSSAAEGGVQLDVELRSVNHRFLDLSLKLPRMYLELEPELRERCASRIERGRLEVSVARVLHASSGRSVAFDRDLYAKLERIYRDTLGKTSPENLASLRLQILSRREVLDVGEIAAVSAGERRLLFRLVDEAFTGLLEMRRIEGRRLASDIVDRMQSVTELRHEIERLQPGAPDRVRERLLARLRPVLAKIGEIDPQRVAAEAAMLADRVDISEELTRLASHEREFERILATPPSGRRLDFLLQEFGREFNTISSKAQDAEVQQRVVAAKAALEKIREQVQNIE